MAFDAVFDSSAFDLTAFQWPYSGDASASGAGSASAAGMRIAGAAGQSAGSGTASGSGRGLFAFSLVVSSGGTAAAVGASRFSGSASAGGVGTQSGAGNARFAGHAVSPGNGSAAAVGASTTAGVAGTFGLGDGASVGQSTAASDASALGQGGVAVEGAYVRWAVVGAPGTGGAQAAAAYVAIGEGSAPSTGVAAAAGVEVRYGVASASGSSSAGFADSGIRITEASDGFAPSESLADATSAIVHAGDGETHGQGQGASVGYAKGPVEAVAEAAGVTTAAAQARLNYGQALSLGEGNAVAVGFSLTRSVAAHEAPSYGLANAEGVRVYTEVAAATAEGMSPSVMVGENVVFSLGVGTANDINASFQSSAFQNDAVQIAPDTTKAVSDARQFTDASFAAAGTSTAHARHQDGGSAEGFTEALGVGTVLTPGIATAAGLGGGRLVYSSPKAIAATSGTGVAAALGVFIGSSKAAAGAASSASGVWPPVEAVATASGLGIGDATVQSNRGRGIAAGRGVGAAGGVVVSRLTAGARGYGSASSISDYLSVFNLGVTETDIDAPFQFSAFQFDTIQITPGIKLVVEAVASAGGETDANVEVIIDATVGTATGESSASAVPLLDTGVGQSGSENIFNITEARGTGITVFAGVSSASGLALAA